MHWLFDAGVLVVAERAGVRDVFIAWATGRGCITEGVLDELVREPEWGPPGRWRELHSVGLPLGGPEAELVAKFRADRTNKRNDIGEHESIAWASVRPEIAFVTNERDAAWTALRNLGPRVWSLEWFLHARPEGLPNEVAAAMLATNRALRPGLAATAW